MITFLSFGGGQDSTDILYRIIKDPAFRNRYVRGHFMVIMSATVNEHDHTNDHVKFIALLCEQHGIEFYLIDPIRGHHPASWPGLVEWMMANDGIMSKAYPKSCTDNLKIRPIYNFLDWYIAQKFYGVDIRKRGAGKNFIKRYAADHGKVRVLLGIAKGEESRVGSNLPAKWMQDTIERVYPLITEGVDRQGAQDSMRSYGLPVPMPSNCKLCPYMSPIELLWLHRFQPKDYELWVALETNKIAKWAALGIDPDKNYGVNGLTRLSVALHNAIVKYGHMTDDQLTEYKFSHGHCVKSKY